MSHASVNVAELRARLNGRRVVASVSGGKDSGTLSLYLKELGIEHDRVFDNTGWEADITYEYLRETLPRHIGPITWLEPPLSMKDLIRHKGMFPSRQRRFCTQELKVFVTASHLKYLAERPRCNFCDEAGFSGAKVGGVCNNCGGTFALRDVVNVTGIRAEESDERAKMPEWEWQEAFDCDTFRPLLDWTIDDVIAIHKRHNCPPNPLYLRGHGRVGCYPCINSTKEEIRLVALNSPERIDELRELEREVGILALARWHRDRERWISDPSSRPPEGSEKWIKKHRRLFEQPFQPPMFFQAKLPDENGRWPAWPIDRVVEWSNTSRGGRQVELFHEPSNGCMRWGLCEQEPKKRGEA